MLFTWVAIASLANAVENGGTYFIWWGAILVGVYIFYKGLRDFISVSNDSTTPRMPVQPKQAVIIMAPFNANAAATPQKRSCEYCGSTVESTAKYCDKCGRTLSEG